MPGAPAGRGLLTPSRRRTALAASALAVLALHLAVLLGGGGLTDLAGTGWQGRAAGRHADAVGPSVDDESPPTAPHAALAALDVRLLALSPSAAPPTRPAPAAPALPEAPAARPAAEAAAAVHRASPAREAMPRNDAVEAGAVAAAAAPRSASPRPADAIVAPETGLPSDGDEVYLPRRFLSAVPQARQPVLLAFPPGTSDGQRHVAVLSLFIDEAGRVRRVRSEGEPLPAALEEAARAAFTAAAFTPGERAGQPVRAHLKVEVVFDSRPLPRPAKSVVSPAVQAPDATTPAEAP